MECRTKQGKRVPWLDWPRLIPCLNPPARAAVADLAAGKASSVCVCVCVCVCARGYVGLLLEDQPLLLEGRIQQHLRYRSWPKKLPRVGKAAGCCCVRHCLTPAVSPPPLPCLELGVSIIRECLIRTIILASDEMQMLCFMSSKARNCPTAKYMQCGAVLAVLVEMTRCDEIFCATLNLNCCSAETT